MKKNNKQSYLAFFTFVALIAILAIQLNWIFKAAKLEEENFNRIVRQALVEAREEIGATASSCNDMKNYLCGNFCQTSVRKTKIAEIDSIIHAKMEIYHIDLEYTFEITDSTFVRSNTKLFGNKCYLQSLNGLLEKDGIKIRLEFPDRNQFLIAQIRGEFLLAIFSILFVMISFILTSRMFRKERQMVQHTSDFINNMVHEFQTPLSNIRFAANLIKKKQTSINDEKVAEYISVIINENHKLEKNVVEILNVSCTGNENGTTEDIDIHQIIEHTSNAFKTRVESLNGSITTDFKAKHSIIHATSDHFTLVFSNLIDNAIKYAVKPPEITLSTRLVSNTIEIKVKDNAIGMEKKELSKIFEKYYRVSTGDVHNVKGFGLGLTYVKKLIEQNNGKIEVSSSIGHGTTFTIHLPLKHETN